MAGETNGAWFATATAAVVRRLPFGLDRIVPPNLLGYAIINGSTFVCDLALLTFAHGRLHWPVPVSITFSYGMASVLSYLLNRVLNFRSHAPAGQQFGVYVAVVATNYLVWILGVGAGLAALGVNYEIARVLAACCEGVYMYVAMRWLVFRDTHRLPPPDPVPLLNRENDPSSRLLPGGGAILAVGGQRWQAAQTPVNRLADGRR